MCSCPIPQIAAQKRDEKIQKWETFQTVTSSRTRSTVSDNSSPNCHPIVVLTAINNSSPNYHPIVVLTAINNSSPNLYGGVFFCFHTVGATRCNGEEFK